LRWRRAGRVGQHHYDALVTVRHRFEAYRQMPREDTLLKAATELGKKTSYGIFINWIIMFFVFRMPVWALHLRFLGFLPCFFLSR
jgi:hypothetical protein